MSNGSKEVQRSVVEISHGVEIYHIIIIFCPSIVNEDLDKI